MSMLLLPDIVSDSKFMNVIFNSIKNIKINKKILLNIIKYCSDNKIFLFILNNSIYTRSINYLAFMQKYCQDIFKSIKNTNNKSIIFNIKCLLVEFIKYVQTIISNISDINEIIIKTIKIIIVGIIDNNKFFDEAFITNLFDNCNIDLLLNNKIIKLLFDAKYNKLIYKIYKENIIIEHKIGIPCLTNIIASYV